MVKGELIFKRGLSPYTFPYTLGKDSGNIKR